MTTTKPSDRIAQIIIERVRKEHWDVGTTMREALEDRAASDPVEVLAAVIRYLDEVHETKGNQETKQ